MIELKFDKNDPFNAHVRICRYCGDTFIANHALRAYCPSKFGRANYCKHQYKMLLAENKLPYIEGVEEIAHPIIEGPKEKNIRILHEMMAELKEKVLSSDLLAATGFDYRHLDRSWKSDKNGRYRAIIDRYTIVQKDENKPFYTLKITKYSGKLYGNYE